MTIEETSVEYIKKSNLRKKEFSLFGRIPFLVKDPLPDNINLENLINHIQKKIPEHLFYEVDMIMVGQFPEFEERQVKSVYTDGAIYATNEQTSEKDLFDDIVHEIAHSLEKPYGHRIYGDDNLELEYLGKRQKLLDILRANGYNIGYDLDRTPDYVQEFDEFLYFDLGFENLKSYIRGLFVTPYSATSISEYFSEGFEHYLVHDPAYLRKISPVLYSKVEFLVEPETEL
jgi:hypothetical protein